MGKHCLVLGSQQPQVGSREAGEAPSTQPRISRAEDGFVSRVHSGLRTAGSCGRRGPRADLHAVPAAPRPFPVPRGRSFRADSASCRSPFPKPPAEPARGSAHGGGRAAGQHRAGRHAGRQLTSQNSFPARIPGWVGARSHRRAARGAIYGPREHPSQAGRSSSTRGLARSGAGRKLLRERRDARRKQVAGEGSAAGAGPAGSRDPGHAWHMAGSASRPASRREPSGQRGTAGRGDGADGRMPRSEQSGRWGTAGRAPRQRPELPPRSRSSPEGTGHRAAAGAVPPAGTPSAPPALPPPRGAGTHQLSQRALVHALQALLGHRARPLPPARLRLPSAPDPAPLRRAGPALAAAQPRAVPLPPGPAPRCPARAHRRHWFSAPGGTAPTGPAVPPRPRLGTAAPGGWGAGPASPPPAVRQPPVRPPRCGAPAGHGLPDRGEVCLCKRKLLFGIRNRRERHHGNISVRLGLSAKKKKNTQHPKFGCKWSFGSIWLQELGVPHSTHVWEHAELC